MITGIRSLRTFAVAVLLMAAAGCSEFYEAHYKDTRELLVPEKEFILPAEGAVDTTVVVYAIGEVAMEYLDGEVSWATVSRTAESGDFKLVVTCAPNEAYRRMFRLKFSLEDTGITDTLCIKQEGIISPYIESAAPFKTVGGKLPETADFKISTNIPEKDLKKDITYLSGGEDWLEVTQVTETSAKVLAYRNETPQGRKAVISLSHMDGWNQLHQLKLYLTQASRDGNIGTVISFAEARAKASPEGTVIEDDLILEGVVISDSRSRNMALNPAVNYNAVDSTYALRTAYFQSKEGDLGFRMLFDRPEDNIFAFGTALRFNLCGAVIIREAAPERYTITGITSSNMVSAEEGGIVVDKSRTIASLTPEDVYTYVSLAQTEFAFKDGAYTNIHEKFALNSMTNKSLSPYNRLDGWASLIVDNEGSAILAPVNTHCNWRRTGSGVQKGTGTTRGIIVHEQMPRWGNTGDYQIRVVDNTGFAMSWNEDSSFSSFARIKRKSPSVDFKNYGSWNEMYTYAGLATPVPSDDISEEKPVAEADMYVENQLEPFVTSTDKPLDWKENLNSLTASKSSSGDKIEGETNDNYATWIAASLEGWYDYDEAGNITGYNGFRIEMSTENLSGTSGMLMTFDMAAGNYSIATAKMFPAHWCVEYSIADGERVMVKELYTGMDHFYLRPLPYTDSMSSGYQYRQTLYSAMGYTQHAFLLPAEVLGKEDVKVWIRPYDDVLTTTPMVWDEDTDTEHMKKGMQVDTYIRFGEINFRYR